MQCRDKYSQCQINDSASGSSCDLGPLSNLSRLFGWEVVTFSAEKDDFPSPSDLENPSVVVTVNCGGDSIDVSADDGVDTLFTRDFRADKTDVARGPL